MGHFILVTIINDQNEEQHVFTKQLSQYYYVKGKIDKIQNKSHIIIS